MAGFFGALRDPEFYRGLMDNTRQLGGGLMAGTLGAPVDIATMLMRPFGYKTPDKQVIGSSEHIGGLMGLDTKSIPYMVGSMLPTDPGDALKYGGLMGAGMTAWHGSPHKFDKFQMDKIGTGEGAQAYGHGLYFAESPEVAKQYQKQLSGDVFQVGDGGLFDPSTIQHLNVRSAARSGDLGSAINRAREIANSGSPVSGLASKDLATLEALQARGGIRTHAGHTYKVDIADSAIPKMLDWDAPIKETQRKALSAAMTEKFGSGASKSSGEQVYKNLIWEFRNKGSKTPEADASALMRSVGIPGIRYKDGMSRGKDAGTHNYVLFDEDLVKILERQ